MRSSLFAIVATLAAATAQQSANESTTLVSTVPSSGYQPAPSATIVAAPGSLPLGADCASSDQCANGASCYASNAGLIKSCGKFNAACSSNSQCATNTCENGLCSGFLAPSAYASAVVSSSSTTSIVATTGGYQPAPSSTVVAEPGSLALGAECATTEQCANGAQCYASNAGLIKSCGKFNAACSSDSQCATNTCKNGLCSGFLAPSAYASASVSSSSIASAGVSSRPTSSGNGTMVSSTRTATPSVYTGGVSKISVEGSLAVVFAALAWML